MIYLPADFVETKFTGYFWSVKDQWLYSIKSGQLKFLVRCRPFRTRYGTMFHGWVVSHEGVKRYLHDEYLRGLSCNLVHIKEIPTIRRII